MLPKILPVVLSALQRLRYFLFFIFLVLFSFASLYISRNAHHPFVDTDLLYFLPAQSQSAMDYRSALERYGSMDHLYLNIQSKDSAALIASKADLISKLNQSFPTEIRSLTISKEDDFFRKNALLYIPTAQLAPLVQELKIWRNCLQKSTVCPTQFTPKWDLHSLRLPLDVKNTLHEIFQGKSRSVSGLEWDSVAQKWSMWIQLRLNRPASDPVFAYQVMQKAKTFTHELDPKFHYEWSGAYTLSEVHYTKIRSMIIAFLFGVVVVFGMLWVLRPRRFKSHLVVLVFALASTGFCALMSLWLLLLNQTHLDLISLLAWVMGIGVALGFSLPLTLSILDSSESELNSKVLQGLQIWCRPWLAWVLGSGGLLLILSQSEVLWAQEFAWSLVITVGFALVLPAFLIPLFILSFRTVPEPKNNPEFCYPDPKARLWAFMCGMALLLFALFYFSPKVELQPEAFARFRIQELENERAKTPGSNQHKIQNMMLLAKDYEALSQFEDQLSAINLPYIQGLLSPRTLYPTFAEQEERVFWIEDIARISQQLLQMNVNTQLKSSLSLLNELAQTKPFTQKQIPVWALESLKEKDHSYGQVAILYTSIEPGQFTQLADLRTQLQRINSSSHIQFASADWIFMDFIKEIGSAKVYLIWGFTAFILCILVLNWQDWRRALQPLFMAAIWFTTSVGLWVLWYKALNAFIFIELWIVSLYALCLILWSTFPTTSPRLENYERN